MNEQKWPWTHEEYLAHEQALRDAAKYERNTHFQGAAKLVYDEIEPLFRAMYEARLHRDTKQADDAEQLIRLTLARRDYDIVVHALNTCSLEAFEIMGNGVEEVPDLKEWPKSEKEGV